MSTFNTRFGDNIASFLNDNFIQPVTTYISENLEELKDKSASEITSILREVIDVQPVSASATKVKNASSNAPTLVSAGMPILGGMGNITAPVVAPKNKKIAKEKPEQKWFALSETQSLYEQRRPVCYYVSTRGENKDKVCCANIENDPDAMKEEEPSTWRCANCTGKSGDIRTKFKTGPVKGTDPLKAGMIPGVNIPVHPGANGPLPGLPVHPTALPPTLSAPIPTLGAMSPAKPMNISPSSVKLTSLPGLPPTAALPPALPIPAIAKPLTPLPVISEPLAPLPAIAETLAPLPVALPMPEIKPMTPPKMKLMKHEGLKSNHLKASIPDLVEIGIIFDYKKNADGTNNTKAIGKIPNIFKGKANEGYEYKLEELSESDVNTIRRYTDKIPYEYTKPAAPVDDDIDI